MDHDIKSFRGFDFDFDLICEYYAGVERQGPGSPEVTQKALSFVEGLSETSQILDIGCGTGGQTMVLAQHTPGTITGLDLFDTFIDLFSKNAAALGLQDRVKGITGSMDHLPFQEGMFDLIWSEGAIYNIGFERGLREWCRYLKPGGAIAVSEVSWFTPARPEEIDTFWRREYPEIDTIPNKLAVMQQAGYLPTASFMLPETCWTDHYYAPQVKAMELFLEKHKGSKAAEDFIANQRREEELYNQYKEFYGYAFYIGRKV